MSETAETRIDNRTRADRLAATAKTILSFIELADGQAANVPTLCTGLREAVTKNRGLQANQQSVSHLLLPCANMARGILDGLNDPEAKISQAQINREAAALRVKLNDVYQEVITQEGADRRRSRATATPEATIDDVLATQGITLNSFEDLKNHKLLLTKEMEQDKLLPAKDTGLLNDAIHFAQKYANAHADVKEPNATLGYSLARLPILFQTEHPLQSRYFQRVGGIDRFVGVQETGARLLGNVYVLENQYCIVIAKDWDPVKVMDRIKKVLPNGLFDVLEGGLIASPKLRNKRIIWLMKTQTYAKIGTFVIEFVQAAFDAHSRDLERSQKTVTLTPAMREQRINQLVERLMANPNFAAQTTKLELRREIEKKMRDAAAGIVDRQSQREGSNKQQMTLQQHREAIDKLIAEATVDLYAKLSKAQVLKTSAEADIPAFVEAEAERKHDYQSAVHNSKNSKEASWRAEWREKADVALVAWEAAKARLGEVEEEARVARASVRAIENAIRARGERIRADYTRKMNAADQSADVL